MQARELANEAGGGLGPANVIVVRDQQADQHDDRRCQLHPQRHNVHLVGEMLAERDAAPPEVRCALGVEEDAVEQLPG